MNNFIASQIEDSVRVKQGILESQEIMGTVEEACQVCLKAYQNGGKLLIAGNGGSAADAQHIAGELISRFYFDRPALPGIALTTDTSIITAIGNDYGYENLFSRQIEGNGKAGDVFLGISTSGNSPNILKGIEAAKDMGITTIGLTGQTGGKMADQCDLCIKIPSTSTPRVQESHIIIGHIICAYIEQVIFKGNV
ncbi:D-sedoheptulose 7-phosphate isomerase [Marinomonas sp. CT5]|uniref:D-sedoheptulose-7-phosphate isomerase n=1 Tax=Marinomonas sp. CT5 TaxID=2066133 RepID=UPI002016A0AC|nr:D-sedoheptulose 7-phosphate isomerase [Marinomonas sp. CT5]